jgi:putative oxidoreductase
MTARTATPGRSPAATTDLGLLLLRLAVGLVFIGHGGQKLFGWFGGGGLDGTASFFESVGYTPGRTYAIIGGVAEFTGGLLLLLGLLVPLGAALLIGQMANAISVKAGHGFWIADTGFEYELTVLILCTALALAGPGVFSIDRPFAWGRGGLRWALLALILGLAAAAVTISMKS